MPGGPEGEAPSPPSARRPSAPPARGPHHGPPPQGHGGHHRLPAPSRSGPGLRLKGPRHAPALSALALPGGKMTAPRLGDGPKERRGKPPLYLPASARMGWAVRGKRSTTPSPQGESLPRPTSRGGAEDPPLAPVPFAQSYPFVCSLIAPPRPSRARPCSECGSCPCPRPSIWGWDPKEARHLGGEGLPDTLSAGGTSPPFSRSALLCRGDAPTTKGRVPAQSAGAPTPAGPRVRVPRPIARGAG
jgi:hypothetical protein